MDIHSMDVEILSLFPEYFVGPFDTSMIKRAKERGILNIRHVNIRDFAHDKHKKVDDRPYGGGPGMILKPKPVAEAIQSVRRENSHVVYLSPQGKVLDARKCQELALKPHLILLCGHYEGVDERVIENEVDEEISIGDYVLTNGALAAIVLIDATSRFIPGVLGHEEAAASDSFQNGLLDFPQFTRPEIFQEKKVPEVLLKGDHEEIAQFRKQESLLKTEKNRPDLYLRHLAWKQQETLKRGECSLEVTLGVRNLKKSIAFFEKMLKLSLIFQDGGRAHFSSGLSLIEKETTDFEKSSLIFRLIVEKKEDFLGVAQSLMRKNSDLSIIFDESKLELPFTDLDGYQWMLVFPKGEEENNGCHN